MGDQFTDLLEVFGLGRSHHVHQSIAVLPVPGGSDHLSVKRIPIQFPRLQVKGPLVGGKGKQYGMFVLYSQERLHRIGSHIGSHGYRVEFHLREKGPGIAARGIAYISALGIGNGKLFRIVGVQIVDRLDKGLPTLNSVSLIEGGIGLIGHSEVMRGINDSLVKSKDRILFRKQVLRHLVQVHIQSDTKE